MIRIIGECHDNSNQNEYNQIGKYVGVRHLISDEKLAQELFDNQAKFLKY